MHNIPQITRKKALILFLWFILSVSLFGCVEHDYEDSNYEELVQEETKPTAMFIEIERGINWHVVYHRDNKVMYVVGGNTFTMLVNPDGTPMLWVE